MRTGLGFFFRVRDESGFDQNAGNVGRLEDGKAGLFDTAPMQGVDVADFTEHFPSQFQTVLDLGAGGRDQVLRSPP